MLLKPRYLVLDSAHLNQWVDAKTSPKSEQRDQVRLWELWLERNGYVVLLCLHHIMEMANHEEAIAARRLRFLKDLPFVAWIGTTTGRAVGTVVTVLGQEVQAALDGPDAGWSEVRDKAKARLIQAGSGADLLGAEPEAWLALRSEFAAQADHARITVAFSRLNTVDIADKPMSELLNGRLRRGEDLRRQLDLMSGSFAVNISKRGDQRIHGPGPVAEAFMQRVEELAGPVSPTTAELVLRGLAVQGVRAEDIAPTSTVGDMLNLGLFRTQMRLAAEGAGIDNLEALRGLQPTQIPSWAIAQALERNLPDLPVREGGELNDSHLVGLAAYADLTLVDKRTLEGVRRLRQKEPGVASLLGRIERAAGLQQIMGFGDVA